MTSSIHAGSGRHIDEALVRLHQIEIEIGPEISDLQHLVEHLPVLRRDADLHIEAGSSRRLNDRE